MSDNINKEYENLFTNKKYRFRFLNKKMYKMITRLKIFMVNISFVAICLLECTHPITQAQISKVFITNISIKNINAQRKRERELKSRKYV